MKTRVAHQAVKGAAHESAAYVSGTVRETQSSLAAGDSIWRALTGRVRSISGGMARFLCDEKAGATSLGAAQARPVSPRQFSTFSQFPTPQHRTHMTSHQTQIIRETFAQLTPRASIVALVFYQRLFALDPSLRGLFRGDIDAQGRKLMQALEFAVEHIDQPEALVATLEALGRRHIRYGVANAHYDTVGVALLDTLEQALGAAFTVEVRQAWATLYGFLARTMQCSALNAPVQTVQGTLN
jgi:hemoglobin-like flavoprotein